MNKKITIDIHGMTVLEAKLKLERLIAEVSAEITEILVIHGYGNQGLLCNMVRKTLKSKKIKQKILSLNPGETTLIL